MTTEPAASRLDAIAQDLVDDHLFVDEVATNEHYSDYVQLLADDIDAAPWPMYIAVIEPIPGDKLLPEAGQIAQLLHRRIGEDGVYIVTSPGSNEIITPGIEGISTVDVSLAESDVMYATEVITTDATSAHLLASLAPVVETDYQSPEAREAIDAHVEEIESTPFLARTDVDLDNVGLGAGRVEGNPDTYWLAVVAVGVLVALVVGRIWSWATAGPTARQEPIPLPELDKARNRLDSIGDIPEFEGDDRLAGLVSEHWPRIENLAAASRALLTTTDSADAVGAEYFATAAAKAADRIRAGKVPAWNRPCYFDPRHRGNTEDVDFPGTDGLTVPGCDACAKRIDAGKLPDTVMVGKRGRRVPYYTRSDVWSATGFGALRDDAPDLVLAGCRGGKRVPKGVAP
jgi:hypothetical protein